MLYRVTTLKKQKGSSRYLIILYKRDSTTDNFLWIFKNFSDKLFHKTSPNHWLQRVFICLECQMILVIVGLRQGNCRNVIGEILRAVVKFNNSLRWTKVFAWGCSWRNLKNFSKFAWKSPCWDPFIGKLQPVIAYKRLLGQLYWKWDAYTETLTQVISVNFQQKYEHDY